MTAQNTNTSNTFEHTVGTGPPRRLDDTASLADFLDVTPWAIREWKRRGLIQPAFVVGRVMRWDRDQVLAQLAQARAEGRQ